MSKYVLEKKLPAITLERKLIEDLEKYISKKATDLLQVETIINNYELTIYESLGKETLKSINDFTLSYFPNDTKKITLEYMAFTPKLLKIFISFGIRRNDSYINIQYDDGCSREIANGICAELLNIANGYKNNNFIYHPNSFFDKLIPVTIGGSAPLAFFLNNLKMPIASASILSAILVLLLYSIFAPIIKPYCILETRKNQEMSKFYSWLFLSFLGFLLFTVVGVFIRKKFFGF